MSVRRPWGPEPPSGDSRTGFVRWLGRAARLCRARVLQRLVARLVDREDAVEPRDLEDLGDVLVGADERERATGRPQALHAADEHAKRRRVDEGRLREVDHELLLTVLDHLDETLLELRGGVEIDLPAEFDDVRVGVDLFVLDVEVHLTPRGVGT